MDDLDFWRGRPVVYRCYDSTGTLLYVGCTSNWPARVRMHVSSDASWWAFDVAKVVVRLARSVAEARALESEAIRAERPRWNINGRGPRISWSEQDYDDVLAALARRPGASSKRNDTITRISTERDRRFGNRTAVGAA